MLAAALAVHALCEAPAARPTIASDCSAKLCYLCRGADMDVALEMAKGGLDGDLLWNLHDLLSHRDDWWVPGKLVDLRQRLAEYRQVSVLHSSATDP